ncbi:MAG: hypothetical protein M8467_09255 [Anaerolineae bacterium]|nr:hypothetical protein [Anaerolineae bacterium]
MYFSTLIRGAGILAAYGYPVQDSIFEFTSALSTVGLSVGITAPGAPAGVLWAEMAAMFLGRLEFFAIVIGMIRLSGDVPALIRARVGERVSLASRRQN